LQTIVALPIAAVVHVQLLSRLHDDADTRFWHDTRHVCVPRSQRHRPTAVLHSPSVDSVEQPSRHCWFTLSHKHCASPRHDTASK